MNQRAIRYYIPLVIIIIALMGGAYFISNSRINIKNPLTTVDPCKQLSEYSCSKADSCKSNYEQIGANRDAVGMPLANFKFTSCSSLTQEEIDIIKVENKNCAETGGYWTKTKGNPTGFCVKKVKKTDNLN